MRIDKFLKISRLIKRRTVAKDACDKGRIIINGRSAKPGTDVNVGDTILIKFGNSDLEIKVVELNEKAKKEDASSLYEIVSRVETNKQDDFGQVD